MSFTKSKVPYFVGTALLILPLLLIKVLPWADYPLHLASLHIITHLDDPSLSQYYELNLRILPNSGMELLTYPLAKFISVYTIVKLFVAFTIVLLVSGVVALNRTVSGQTSVWPLIALVFVHNGWLKYGALNQIFGIAAALWATNGYLKIRQRSAWVRTAFLVVVIPLLFVTHLYAVCLFALAVGSYEIWQAWTTRSLKWLYPLASFALLAPLALAGSSVHERVSFDCAKPDGLTTCAFNWTFGDRIDGIKLIYQLQYLPWDSMIDKAVLAVTGLLVVYFVWKKRFRAHPAGPLMLILVLPIFMVMPGTLFQSWGAAQKLPICVFFLALPFFYVAFESEREQAAFATIVLAIVLVRMVNMSYGMVSYRDMQAAYLESFEKMSRGARVLTVDAVTAKDFERAATTQWMTSLCSIERSCLNSTNITNPTNQVMKVRPEWKRLDNPMLNSVYPRSLAEPIRGSHYEHWRQDYQYVYFVHVDQGFRPSVAGLKLIYEYQHPDWVKAFQLYAVE